jgi:hypothetical protein
MAVRVKSIHENVRGGDSNDFCLADGPVVVILGLAVRDSWLISQRLSNSD